MTGRVVQLRLFGPFAALDRDGEPLHLSGKKLQALVAYMAVEGARVHTREELASLLWGDTGDERARHNLRQALSKIRRNSDAWLAEEEESPRFNRGQCWVDVGEFEELSATDEPEALERAVALYRRDFLEGFSLREAAFDNWLRDTRTRLRERAFGVLERLTTIRVDEGRIQEAIDLNRGRLAIDAACEPAYRSQMELLAGSGRRSEALRVYQQCLEALARELGVKPSRETTELFNRLRSADNEAPAAVSDAVVPEQGSPEPPSVAVLPFENLSGDANDYFVDGMTEDITTALSCFGSLLVIARASAFSHRDATATVEQIARDLGAQFVVQGSVRRAGNRVRITVQLVDTNTRAQIWARKFDRELEDIFVVQDEVTATVVSTLAGRVEASRLAHARRMPPDRLDAYHYVLRGKDHHHRHTAKDCETAIDMFERAIARDPNFAPAHAWLACGLGQARAYRPDEDDTLVAQAQVAAERARELDAEDAECHRVLANIALIRHDLANAQSHQERGLQLNPNDDRQVCAMGQILCFRGQHEASAQRIEHAMRLNPYHPESLWLYLGRALFHQGRHEDALAALGHLTRPRVTALAYRVAAAASLDNKAVERTHTTQLRKHDPNFDTESFLAAIPYEHEQDRAVLRDALRQARL
jgi:adenylate cyclase